MKRDALILSPVLCLMLVLSTFLLTGCATTPAVREVTVAKQVPVPYHQPCPKAADIPPVPKHVAVEHPAMPRQADGTPDYKSISRILADKVLELFGYTDKADGVLNACSKP